MNWIKTKNNTKINLNKIPSLDIDTLRDEIIKLNKRPVGFFGKEWGEESTRLFVILADDENSDLYISSCIFSADEKGYESLTQTIPSFHVFEREFYEQFGIKPLNHPWLKPLRSHKKEYKFFEMEGEEVHQVAVGPIHAGVIEPGHFRFMCNGETVYHLEIMLGYQNRGVEKLMVEHPTNQLAESICGDSVIAHNLAYSKVMECLKDIKVSKRAQLIRTMALEMERAAIHIGDLGAIAGDIAYLMGASVFGATRTLVINTMLEFSGSRFGRGLINVGGVNFDIDNEKIERAIKTLTKVEKDVDRMVKTMLKNSSVMSRLEKTGVVSTEKALEIGLVGMAARACGVNLDSRFDFADECFKSLALPRKLFKGKGDVNSRFKLRYQETMESLSIAKRILDMLKNGYKEEVLNTEQNALSADSMAISIVEGWRGEVVHIGLTDMNANLSRYKIKDPSFNNWYGLALAVRNNGVSDFPLCNKSFNLSYCGNDL